MWEKQNIAIVWNKHAETVQHIPNSYTLMVFVLIYFLLTVMLSHITIVQESFTNKPKILVIHMQLIAFAIFPIYGVELRIK